MSRRSGFGVIYQIKTESMRKIVDLAFTPDIRFFIYDDMGKSVIVSQVSLNLQGADYLNKHVGEFAFKDPDDFQIPNLTVEYATATEPMVRNYLNAKAIRTYIAYIESLGYVETKDFSPAKLGSSELCMHTQTTERIASRLWINPTQAFGHALLDDNSWMSGCFHKHADGTISLS